MSSIYTLNGDDEALVRRLVESGRYASLEEVVREGLRRLADDEEEEADPLLGYSVEELRRMLKEGEESGIMDEEPSVLFERLKAKYRAMAMAKQET